MHVEEWAGEDVTLRDVERALCSLREHSADGMLNDDVAVLLLEHTTSDKEFLPRAGEHDWRESLQR